MVPGAVLVSMIVKVAAAGVDKSEFVGEARIIVTVWSPSTSVSLLIVMKALALV